MDFNRAFKRIKKLKKPGSIAEEVLELYQNILEFQNTSFDRTGIDYGNLPVSMAVERPLLSVFEKNIPAETVSNLVKDFFEFISLFGTHSMREEAKRAAESSLFGPPQVKETFTNYIRGIGEVEGIPPEFLNLTVLSVAPILFSPLVGELEKQLPEDFNGTNCPFCGYRPVTGYFSKEKEGKRFLVCPVCYGEWPSKRDVCPYCGNEELDEHSYYVVQGEEGVRVDICSKCKRYIKTFDERVFEENGELCVPLVEDVATPHIDIRMAEEGFEKVAKNLFYF